MAVVRNLTSDALSLFRSDGQSVRPNDEVAVPDEDFVDRAWPKSTWSLVRKPGKGFLDASSDDAYLFIAEPDDTVADLKAQAEEQGIDISGLTKKADIAAAIAAGPTHEESA